MKRRINLDEVREFIRNSSEDTKIYIGSDSEKFRRHGVWYADYSTVVVIHHHGNRGCKIFGDITTEIDYDQRKDRPAIRLMQEVMKAAQMYIDLADAIGDRQFEIHLDINPNEMYGSSCVVQQAIGYIRGMCNVVPLVKPEAFAASYCADRYKEIRHDLDVRKIA